MTTFWTQLLLNAIVGGALSTIVGVIVGFLFKQWLRKVFEPQQEAATAAAHHAATRAGEAAVASRAAAQSATTASTDARAAGDNSRQANAAIEWLAEQLAVRDAINEELRERIDGLLGTRARQLASERVTPPGLLIPLGAGDEDDPTTVTGRHRLHTQRIPTAEGDRP